MSPEHNALVVVLKGRYPSVYSLEQLVEWQEKGVTRAGTLTLTFGTSVISDVVVELQNNGEDPIHRLVSMSAEDAAQMFLAGKVPMTGDVTR